MNDFCPINSLKWLHECGISFNSSYIPCFNLPVHKILSKLDKWSTKSREGDIEEAITSLKQYLMDGNFLLKWLENPPKPSKSMINLLLEVKALQTQCFDVLCQFISISDMEFNDQNKKIIHMIIQDMKFHSRIYNYESITTSIFDCIHSVKDSIKQIMIDSLYHILDCSPTIIENLTQMMTESPILTKDILSALEGFGVSSEDKEKLRIHMINDILPSVHSSDLNIVLQYLMDTTDEENSQETVDSFRSHLLIEKNSNATDDTNLFIILMLRPSLRFNKIFQDCYVKTLQNIKELSILDVWVLFCLFDISSLRSDISQIIIKLIKSDILNVQLCSESVIGHHIELESLNRSICDFVGFCLDTSNDEVNQIGMELAFSFFIEAKSLSIQQDILAFLLQQIGIGEEVFKMKSASVLLRLCNEYPKMLSYHIPLLESVLFSYQTLPIQIFKIVTKVIVQITFSSVESIEKCSGSQIHIFLHKMLNRTTLESVKYGVIVAASILCRYGEICGESIQPVQEQFDYIMDSIEENDACTDVLLQELFQNLPDSFSLNRLLFERLQKMLDLILIDTINDDTEWFRIGSPLKALDIYGILQASNNPSIISNKMHAKRKRSLYLFTHSANMLYFETSKTIGHDVSEILTYSLRLFPSNPDELSTDLVFTSLYIAHNWIMSLLNFFCKSEDPNVLHRLIQLLEIDHRMISAGKDEISIKPSEFIPPNMKIGSLFKKFKSINKVDSIIYELHQCFCTPSVDFVKYITFLQPPFCSDTIKVFMKMLTELEYLLLPSNTSKRGKNDEKSDLVYSKPTIKDPPLRIIEFLFQIVLPHITISDHEEKNFIVESIFKIGVHYLTHSYFKKQELFEHLLLSICGDNSRKKAFIEISSHFKDDDPIEIKSSMLEFLSCIIHSGPATKINVLGSEYLFICDQSRSLLKNGPENIIFPVFKTTLVMFFDHNPNIIEELSALVPDLLSPDTYQGDKGSLWNTVKGKAAIKFLEQSLSAVNKKIRDFNKKHVKNAILDDNSVQAMMNHLNSLVTLTKNLLETTAHEGLPIDILKTVLKSGKEWINETKSVLPFLKTASEVDKASVQQFFECVKTIRRIIDSKMTHVKANEEKLYKIIPQISKQSWSLVLEMVKIMKSIDMCEDLQMELMQERNLNGKKIRNEE